MMKKTKLGIVSIAFLALTITGCNEPPPPKKVDPKPVELRYGEEETKVRETIDGWLREQQSGNKGLVYWDDPDDMTGLYSVRAWTILNVDYPGTTTKAKVRIDSSNKGGQQVTITWTLTLVSKGKEWKIRRMDEQ
jgi:hypothetical protein